MTILNETQVLAALGAEIGCRTPGSPTEVHREVADCLLDAMATLCIDLGTTPLITQWRGDMFCVTLTDNDDKVVGFAARQRRENS